MATSASRPSERLTSPASLGGHPTRAYLVANLVVSFLGAASGGVVVGWLGRSRAWIAAAMVAAAMTALSAGSGFRPAAGQPSWYPLTVYLLGVLGVAAGLLAQRSHADREMGP